KKISENELSLEKVEKYIAANQKDESIDGLLSLLKSQIAEWKTENASIAETSQLLESQKKALHKFDASCEQQKQELIALQDYLAEHRADANLVNLLPEMNGYANEAEGHHRESARLQREIESKQNQLASLAREREQAQSNLNALKNDKETIIQEDVPVVVAELRRSLKPGKPCPVCGSLEHLSCEETAKIENGADCLNDFANKLREINGEMEQIQRKLDGLASQEQNLNDMLREFAEKQNGEIAAESSALDLLNAKLEPWKITAIFETMSGVLQNLLSLKTTYLQKKENADSLLDKVTNAAVNRAKLTGDVNVAEQGLQKSQIKAQELSQKIETTFAVWFSNIRMDDVNALLAELEKKNDYWKKAQDKKVKVESELEKIRSKAAQFKENLVQAQSRLDEIKRKLDESRNALAAFETKRREMFGEKSVDEERKDARDRRETAERLANDARRKEQQMRETKISLDNSIADLNNRIAEIRPKLAGLQTLFLENLSSKNFADEQEFMVAKLPEAERKSLQQSQKRVEENLTSAQTSVKNFNDQLAEHQQKRNFEESEDVAKQNRDVAKSKLNECTVNLAAWTEQKKNDALLRQKFDDMQAELSALKSKRNDWEQMQRWFNGNRLETGNGDVFVKFIQTITLRNLLKIANGYLRDMFPRYEMVTEPNTLNIQLVDHDNSDAVRPIDNISGGEGFLVSLSLALGISTLASRNVRIDSMFLDEGFGTLDSKMLQETVIVLQKMQQEKGKLLGVITHVDLVKSELPTHIEVTPCGGRSILSGAGVKN
ncbi:MAG: chromosome segregation protein SMC, partial [Fibrobacter sp.]|nr:chromosome segregation protein SMC [Fibrobacter sp.]